MHRLVRVQEHFRNRISDTHTGHSKYREDRPFLSCRNSFHRLTNYATSTTRTLQSLSHNASRSIMTKLPTDLNSDDWRVTLLGPSIQLNSSDTDVEQPISYALTKRSLEPREL